MFDWDGRRMAISADGFTWNRLEVSTLISEDESHFFFDERRGFYTLMHKLQTKWGRSVWLATSSDWENWEASQLVLHTDEIDRDHRRQPIEAVARSSIPYAPHFG